MLIQQMFRTWLISLLCHVCVKAREVEILSTSKETSSLVGWRIENYVDGVVSYSNMVDGWGEVSVFNGNESVRGFEVCPDTQPYLGSVTQSWLRSPYLNITGVSRIYVSLQFWMRECHDLKDTICRETFKVFYRLIDENEGINDEVPLSKEHYNKVDTVAAEVRFQPNQKPVNYKINQEMVKITIPSNQAAVYVAIMDEGACISVTSLRIYYIVCGTVINNLAVFPETHTGQSDTSLVKVDGWCVDNAIKMPISKNSNATVTPQYRCTSSGEWNVATGSCQCRAGFQPDAAMQKCSPCPSAYYKPLDGNTQCLRCPPYSFTTHLGATKCQCTLDHHGQQPPFEISSSSDSIRHKYNCEICSKLPSKPTLPVVNTEAISQGKVEITWKPPDYFGRCRKVVYCILCHACPSVEDAHVQSASPLSSTSSSSNNSCSVPDASSNSSMQATHTSYCEQLTYSSKPCLTENLQIQVGNLRGHTRYAFSVVAVNGVTEKRFPQTLPVYPRDREFSLVEKKIALSLVLETSAVTVFVTTQETLPSQVFGIHLLNINQTTASIQWESPRFPNGKILSYEVWYFVSSDMENIALSVSNLRSMNTANVTTSKNSVYLKPLDRGTEYSLCVRAKNIAGFSNFSALLKFVTLPDSQTTVDTPDPTTQPSTLSSYIYLIAAAAVVLILFGTFAILWFKCSPKRRSKKSQNGQYHAPQNGDVVDGTTGYTEVQENVEQQKTNICSVTDQRTYIDPFSLGPMLPHNFLCETLPSLITIEEVIGCGEFGEVFQGKLLKSGGSSGTNHTLDVAVKQLHAQCEPHEQLDFLREAMALERFQHPNIVKLEAVVMKSRPFMIVTELMDHGCLEAFLRAHRQAHKAFPSTVLVRMLRGVARGMEYLSSLQYVHRDLAARNVLVNSDLVCKVSDFGLTRHMTERESDSDCSCPTYTTQGGKIAIRWTSPEAVAFRAYSQASDVWSFGVFAWEVATYGDKPYWDLTNQQVLQAVNEGFRLPAPEDCPSILHQMMLSCWQRDRHARPTFVEVGDKLDSMLDDPESLLILASPASTGADDAFFTDSSPPSPAPPVPTLTEGQSRHNYATCQEVSDDVDDVNEQNDVFDYSRTFDSLLAKPRSSSARRHGNDDSPLLGNEPGAPAVGNPYAASIV